MTSLDGKRLLCCCGGPNFHPSWDGCVNYLLEQNALLGVEVRSYIDIAANFEDQLKQLRQALALYHSMVLCGESPSEQSEKIFVDVMGINS